jgi:hypothetical protein
MRCANHIAKPRRGQGWLLAVAAWLREERSTTQYRKRQRELTPTADQIFCSSGEGNAASGELAVAAAAWRGSALWGYTCLLIGMVLLAAAEMTSACLFGRSRAVVQRLLRGGENGTPPRSFADVITVVRLPSTACTVLAAASPLFLGSSVAALTLHRHATSVIEIVAEDVTMVIVGVALMVGAAAATAWKTSGERVDHSTRMPDPLNHRSYVPAWLHKANAGGWRWVSRTKRHHHESNDTSPVPPRDFDMFEADSYHTRFKPLFEEYIPRRTWFGPVDLLVSSILMAVGSVQAGTAADCVWLGWTIVSINVIHLALLLVLRPFAGWLPQLHAIVLTMLNSVAAALALVPSVDASVIGGIVSAASVFAVLRSVLSVAIVLLELPVSKSCGGPGRRANTRRGGVDAADVQLDDSEMGLDAVLMVGQPPQAALPDVGNSTSRETIAEKRAKDRTQCFNLRVEDAIEVLGAAAAASSGVLPEAIKPKRTVVHAACIRVDARDEEELLQQSNPLEAKDNDYDDGFFADEDDCDRFDELSDLLLSRGTSDGAAPRLTTSGQSGLPAVPVATRPVSHQHRVSSTVPLRSEIDL